MPSGMYLCKLPVDCCHFMFVCLASAYLPTYDTVLIDNILPQSKTPWAIRPRSLEWGGLLTTYKF